jgi:ribosome-binding protein aMBF1 (putative translation factor)
MDKATRVRLEAAGFRVGNAEDFLGLTEEERRLVDLRIAVSRAVRRRREEAGVTQKKLAAKLKSSQSRVAKIEAGAADVSLDLLFKALFATGGSLDDLTARASRRKRAAKKDRAGSTPADARADPVGVE